MAIIYLLSIYLDKYCNVEGLHWFGGLKFDVKFSLLT
jgi:hypothetical protein